MRPSVASTKRKKDRARVLFPLPVRPRTPTFSPGLTLNEMLCKTLGKSGFEIDEFGREEEKKFGTYSVSYDKIVAFDASF